MFRSDPLPGDIVWLQIASARNASVPFRVGKRHVGGGNRPADKEGKDQGTHGQP